MTCDFVIPYYDCKRLVSEIESIEFNVNNSEIMKLVISKFEEFDKLFHSFLISQRDYIGSEFYVNSIESVADIFTNCLEHVKKCEGRQFDETESGIKLCLLFLPFLAEVMKEYYSMFLER